MMIDKKNITGTCVIPKAIAKAGIEQSQLDNYQISEAFSV